MFAGRLAAFSVLCGLTLVGCSGGAGGSGAGGSGAGGSGAGGSGGSTGAGASGGTTTTTTTSDVGGCPADVPDAWTHCGDPIDCSYSVKDAACPSALPVYVSCVDQTWRVWHPVTCDPFPAGAACDPTGSWTVTTTGPYDPADSLFDSYTTFKLDLIAKPDGLLYLEGFSGHVSDDGCALSAFYSSPESCTDVDGQSFCSWMETVIELDLSTAPATGTVNMSCWGECGGDSTAPVSATKAP